MDKLNMQSPDFTDQNIDKLAALFPNCVTEAKGANGKLQKAIDFDLLKQELSNNIIDGPRERYQLNWPGKREALLTANTPITKTLRPCREESVDFDTTENLFIEGDNLDALKLLQETYLDKVKMIYIDPPYNTGKDFVYADNFTVGKDNYDELSEQKDEDGGRLVANPDSNGRFHSDWLDMMYPRLKLARNLLRDDGVIVVHIDENEYPNLEKLLTEVFGSDNNLGTVVWDKRNPKGDATGIAQQHELISFYCKNRTIFKEKVDFRRPKENAETMLKKVSHLISTESHVTDNIRKKYKDWLKKQDFSGGDKAYSLIDDKGNIYRPVSMAWPNKKKAPDDYYIPLIHPETKKECPVPERGWRNPPKTMTQLQKDDLILFGKDETTQPNRKYFLKENLYENVSSLLYYGGSDDALLAELGVWFDTPKAVNVSIKLLQSIAREDDIVLDFFAGSSTTAHAVMQLNAEDGGNRKFIMVQLPEVTGEKSEAFKAGYATIAEISKERIRRAGKKIKEELKEKPRNTQNTRKDEKEDPSACSVPSVVKKELDTGFRVLKVDSSNMKDVYYAPDAITQADLIDQADNIKEDRTAEDLLFQVLLDWGVDLSLPISRETLTTEGTENTEEKTKEFEVFFVDENALCACFEKDINEDLVKQIAKREPLRAVFRDAGYGSDSTKINIKQIFKLVSPQTEVKAI